MSLLLPQSLQIGHGNDYLDEAVEVEMEGDQTYNDDTQLGKETCTGTGQE